LTQSSSSKFPKYFGWNTNLTDTICHKIWCKTKIIWSLAGPEVLETVDNCAIGEVPLITGWGGWLVPNPIKKRHQPFRSFQGRPPAITLERETPISSKHKEYQRFESDPGPDWQVGLRRGPGHFVYAIHALAPVDSLKALIPVAFGQSMHRNIHGEKRGGGYHNQFDGYGEGHFPLSLLSVCLIASWPAEAIKALG